MRTRLFNPESILRNYQSLPWVNFAFTERVAAAVVARYRA
jgi:hypothetical protein